MGDYQNDGSVSFDHFEQVLLDERVQALLRSLEIEVRDAYVLFDMCDTLGAGRVDLQEFVTSCGALRGGAKAVHVEKIDMRCLRILKKLDKVSQSIDQFIHERGQTNKSCAASGRA